MGECIFCKIIAGEAAGDPLFADEQVTAFRDIHPVAPVHILIVPNKHIPSLNELSQDEEKLVGRLFFVGRELAKREGIDLTGHRLIINTGVDGGQVVPHLHLHLIGGQVMRHPIG